MSKFKRPGGPSAAPSPAPATPARRRYKSAASIEVGVQANYLRPGHYLAMIEGVETGTTTTKKEDFVSVKLAILAAEDDSFSDLDRQFGRGLHAVGETASWFSKETGETALYFEQNMLKFALVAWNMTQEELAAEEKAQGPDYSFIDAIKDGSTLKGVVVELKATMRQRAEDRKAGKPADSKNVSTFPNWIRRVPFAEVKTMLAGSPALDLIPDLDAKIAEEAKPAS